MITERKGSVLILGLLMMAISLLIGGIFLSLTVMNIQHISSDLETNQAFWLSYAGLMQTFHDLEDSFSDHQQQLIEIKFDEGICKVGTVPLQQQGVREILIVSTGYKGNGKISLAGRVKIDSTTDYVLFSEGDVILDSTGSISGNSETLYKSFFYFGPVHINGNLKTKIITRTLYHNKIVFAKSKDISGPTLSLSGILFYYLPAVNITSEGLTDFGLMGGNGWIIDDLNGICAGEADISSNTDRFLLRYEDLIWNGRRINFGWDDVNYYPSYTSIPDKTIDTTGDYVFQDKDHLGYYIKVPYIDDIKEENYRNFIDTSWYIKSINFTNFACTKVGFINDALAKKEIIADGKWDGVNPPNPSLSTNPDLYKFNYNPSRIIKNVYVVEYDKAKKYNDETPYVGYSEQPILVNDSTNWIFLPLSEYDPNSSNPSLSIYRMHPSWRAVDGVLTLEEIRHQYLNWMVGLTSGYNYHLGRRRIILDPRYAIPNDRQVKEIILGMPGMGYAGGEVLTVGQNYGVGIDAKIEPGPGESRRVIIFPKMYNASGNPLTQYSWGNVNFRLYNDTISYLPAAGGPVNSINDNTPISPPPLEYTGGDIYDMDYPLVSPDSNTLPDPYPFPNYNGKGYYDVYVKNFGSGTYQYKTLYDVVTNPTGDYTFPVDGAYVSGGTTNPNSHYIQFETGKEPVANSTIVINRRHNILGEGAIDPDLYPGSYLFARLYPPKKNCKILIDHMTECVKINLSLIDKDNCPKDSRYSLGFIDYNKNGRQEPGELSKYGIIYSKVPLLVGGTPKVPVTIICEDDVYVQPINKEYALDSKSASPVGIISKKAIWIDHSGKYNNNADNSDKEVMLNKVGLFTGTTRLFHYGGTAPRLGVPGSGFNFMNKTRLVGSLCLVKKNSKGENSAYDVNNVYIDKIREEKYEGGIYASGAGSIEYQHQSYANSFRYEPPRHMPVYFRRLVSTKNIISTYVDVFYSKLSPYANENKSSYVSQDVYSELLTQIEK